MNKVLAEIIAGLIPHKMTRNRWRGILRYGLINSLKLKKEIKRCSHSPRHYLSILTIAKNEGPYIKEWLEWHIEKGVEKFYFYDNGSTDNTKEILQPYIAKGIVEYIYFPGYRKQIAAYDDFFTRFRYESRWVAVIDMDEFIVPLDRERITDYLRDMEHAPLVEVNWLCYGSSGQEKKMPGKVMNRFLRHSKPDHPLNKHVKSILDPRRVYGMIGCHEAARISGKGVDSNGDRIKISWRDRPPVHQRIRINHYAVKSYEEFLEKKGKGRASGPSRHIDDKYFHEYDLNDEL